MKCSISHFSKVLDKSKINTKQQKYNSEDQQKHRKNESDENVLFRNSNHI